MISIIIPAHNEAKRIEKTIHDYCQYFPDDEIIVILNACTDDTIEIVKELQATYYSNLAYLDLKNGGKGYAIMEGFKIASGERIGFVDADDSTSASEFYSFVNVLNNRPRLDGVIGSRRMPASIVEPRQPLIRRISGKCFNMLVNCMFNLGYNDTQCGAKLFKKEVAKEITKIEGSTQWAFDVALLYEMKLLGHNIAEVSITWRDEPDSKINIVKTSIRMFLSIVRLRILHSPFKFIISIYNKCPEWTKLHHYI
jgi:glycosyltransferase involved in cell wall biosynthesis